jgi:hypothetical protein
MQSGVQLSARSGTRAWSWVQAQVQGRAWSQSQVQARVRSGVQA